MEEGTCTCEGVVPSLEVGDHSDSHLGVPFDVVGYPSLGA